MGDALRNLRCQSLRYAAVSGAATMARWWARRSAD